MKLSLHMIVRNSGEKLERTLESVKTFVDEIIIVDTGSIDNTKEIAKKYGANIYDFEWIDDFSAARNYALEKTTGDWVTWFDAGDVLSPSAIKSFEDTKQELINNPDTEINYILGFLNRNYDGYGNVYTRHITPRIVKKIPTTRWLEPIHEALVIQNPVHKYVVELTVDDPDGQLSVASQRNLDIIDGLINKSDSPRYQYLRVRELEFLGRYEEAVLDSDIVHKLPLDNGSIYDYYLVIARCFNKIGYYDESRNMLLAAAMTAPEIPDAFVMLGDIEYSQGKYDRAIPYYRAALRPQNTQLSWVMIMPYYTYEPLKKLGECYRELKDYDKSNEFYSLALEVAPEPYASEIREAMQ
jgi:glycosyltransferase involved in cell wall biosynthesis